MGQGGQSTEFREGWKQVRQEMRRRGTGVGMHLHFYPDGRFEGRLTTNEPAVRDGRRTEERR